MPHSTKCPDGVFVWISARDSIAIGAIVEWAWKKEEVIRKGKEAVQNTDTWKGHRVGTVRYVLSSHCPECTCIFSFFLVFCSSSRLFLFSTFSFPMSFTPFLLSRFIKPLICYLGKIFPCRYLGNRPIQSRAAHCVWKRWGEEKEGLAMPKIMPHQQ